MKILIQSYHITTMISVDRGNDMHRIISPHSVYILRSWRSYVNTDFQNCSTLIFWSLVQLLMLDLVFLIMKLEVFSFVRNTPLISTNSMSFGAVSRLSRDMLLSCYVCD